MASNILDADGQPPFPFNAARRTERDISELLGLAKGMLADGRVCADEVEFLHRWAKNHPDVLDKWPISALFSRLTLYMADGHISEAERADLQDLLTALVGGSLSLILGFEAPSELPLDSPPPLVGWHDEVYVFTGRFAYGTRRQCQQEVEQRGGRCEDNVTRRTSYLVLGTFGSRDWKHSSYGAKIQRAVDLREAGFAVRIVGEDHWAAALSPIAGV